LLRVEHVACGYGRIEVLADFGIAIGKGEVVALFGPNGSGKSTLLKVVAGAIRATRGRVLLEGDDLTRLDAADRVARGIVLCPEGRRIFTSLTVEENLRIGATPLRATLGAGFEDAVREGIEAAYALFPVLRERRRTAGGALSGGQQQMLAIGRALTARPRLLLLDEPSLGLAPIVADGLYESLAALKRRGIAMVIAEEGAGRPLRLADRGILLRRGRIVLDGPASDGALWADLGARYLSEEVR
jgi:branched-chain amino acid transport system ATP-binding protein